MSVKVQTRYRDTWNKCTMVLMAKRTMATMQSANEGVYLLRDTGEFVNFFF